MGARGKDEKLFYRTGTPAHGTGKTATEIDRRNNSEIEGFT